MTPPAAPARDNNHRLPGAILRQGVWLSARCPRRSRDVHELLLARGLDVTHDAIRQWCRPCGQAYAPRRRGRRAQPGPRGLWRQCVGPCMASGMPCGARSIRTTTSSTSWCRAAATRKRRRSAFARCARGCRTCPAGLSPRSCPATGRRSARACPGAHTARVALATTAVSTRIAPHANAHIACRGCHRRGMPSAFCPRLGAWPTTADPDGLWCLPPRTAKRYTTAARVGPT